MDRDGAARTRSTCAASAPFAAIRRARKCPFAATAWRKRSPQRSRRIQGAWWRLSPIPEIFTQYFFVAAPDFDAAGLSPEVAEAIEKRLAQDLGRVRTMFARGHLAVVLARAGGEPG